MSREIKSEADKFEYIWSEGDIDLNSKAIKSLVGKGGKAKRRTTNPSHEMITEQVNGIVKKASVNERAVHVMKKIGIYGISPDVSNSTVPVFKFQPQSRMQNSTAEAAVSAWKKINKLKSNQTGALYAFDLETFGGTLQDKRWSPAGITEFAMIKHDFATNQRSVHNVLMTDDDTVAQLESHLGRYVDIMRSKGGIDKLKEHNDLYVFAMRMSLYDPTRGAKFSINDKGIYQVDELLDTADAQAGNIDSVIRAVNNFVNMNKELKNKGLYYDDHTGMARSLKTFMDLSGEMYSAMNNNTGVIMGHNIVNFDRSINDKQIRHVFNMQQAILNSSTATPEEKAKAQNAINHMNKAFGGNVGFGFKKGGVLDTLYPTRHAISSGVIEAANAELGTLADMFYASQAALGTKHVAVHDTMLNMSMVLDAADGLNGKSLMHKMMAGYSAYNNENAAVSLNSNQVFKVVNTTLTPEYSGKGFANFKRYNSTGEIYTSGGYRIDKDGSVKYDKYSGTTGFTKGGFYTLGSQGFLNLKDLDQEQVNQLRSMYTDLSGDKIFYTSFKSHDKTSYSNPHEVFMFASSIEEMEGMLGSSLAHVANITDTGYNIVEKNRGLLEQAAFNMQGDLLTKSFSNDTDVVVNAIKMAETTYINKKANEAVFTGKQSLRNISGLLTFDKEVRSGNLKGGLEKMAADGVSLTTILTRGNGTYNGVQYFDEKQYKRLKKSFTNHLGYSGRIDQRSLIKLSAAYEKVMSEKEYHQNVVDVVKQHFGTNTVTGKNSSAMNDYYLNLNRMATVQILQDAGMSDNKIVNAVLNATDYMTHEQDHYKNVFDFRIGKTFKRVGKISDAIETPFSLLGNNGDVLTLNLNQTNSELKFIDKIYDLYAGDGSKNTMISKDDLAKKKNEAMFFFLKDLHTNEDYQELYKHKGFRTYMNSFFGKNAERPGADFDAKIAAGHLKAAAQHVKGKNPLAGIVSTVKNVNVLNTNDEIAGLLNKADISLIQGLTNSVKMPEVYDDNTRAKYVEQLVQIFGVGDLEFEENTAHLSTVDKRTVDLIRKVSNDQMRGHLDDLLKTAKFGGMTVHYDPAGKKMFLERGGRVEELTNMPVLGVNEDGMIHLKSGGSDINVGLNLRVADTKNGKRLVVGTNLNEEFGDTDKYFNMALSRFAKGTDMPMTELNAYIGVHTKEKYEDTRVSGLKTDKTSGNKRLNLSAADELMYDLLSPTGDLNKLLDDYTFIDDNLMEKVHPYLRKMKVKPGKELPPDLAMVIQADKIGLTSLMIDKEQKYADDLAYVLQNSGYSIKETALVRGKVQIGDRVLGTFANVLDNIQRPPMTGAGTVNDLSVDDIKKLKQFDILPGTILESNKTEHLNHKTVQGRDYTYEFRGRQAYLSNPVIYERMLKQKKTILDGKGKINNRTINDMTNEYLSEVYDHLTETLRSGTYEQSRFGDARVFNEVLDMPVDVQYLSINKDVMSSIRETSTEKQFATLNGLMGSVQFDEETGQYKYTRRAGTMVKKGKDVISYIGYGGVSQEFGSKHDIGVLSFSVSDNRTELSDEHISEILNNYSHVFEQLEDENSRTKAMLTILQSRGLKTTFKITNANQGSLYKVQDAGVEKGMTLLPNVSIGSMNENVREYMEALDDDMARTFVKRGMIPHEGALKALHEDIAAKRGTSVNEEVRKASAKIKAKGFVGFGTIEDVLSLVKDEKNVLSELSFGDYGAFKGLVSVANDNIPGHDNAGLATFGLFSEAVWKYSQVSGKSMQEATKDIVGMMENDPSLNFMQVVKGSERYKATGAKITVDKNATMIMNLADDETLDYNNENFINLLRRIDEKIVEADPEADRSLRLVHKNVWKRKKGGGATKEDEVIGSFMFSKNADGEWIIDGGLTNASHSIIRDSETISGVSADYIKAVKELNELNSIDKGSLTEADKAKIDILRRFIGSQKDHAKFVTMDDQMISVLSSKRFNADTEKDLTEALGMNTGKERYITPEKMAFLTGKTGGAISYDPSTGQINLSDDIKNMSAYQGFIDQLKEYRYYNPAMDTQELTKEMLEKPEYSHLKEIYEDIVEKRNVEKLGLESAENFYKLRGMNAAAEFNNKRNISLTDVQEMKDKHGFEVMHIKDYVPRDGMGADGVIESIRDRRLVVDLGDHLPNSQRYIAVPAGGQMIGDMDALSPAQGKLTALKRQYEVMESLEGGGFLGITEGMTEEQIQMIKEHSMTSEPAKKKFERAVDRTLELRNEIVDLTDSYARKGTSFTDAYKIVVPEAAQRAKILSVTDTQTSNEVLAALGSEARVSENSATFMSKAKIQGADGKYYSLGEMSEKGLHYDFERVGMDEFINAGYFDSKGNATSEKLAELGLKDTDEMIEYLETHGSAVVAIRYPVIDKGSLFVSRQYLDRSLNGKNVKSVSASAMGKLRGDSDGDSESSFRLVIGGAAFDTYERQRQLAIEDIKSAGGTLSESTIKDRVLLRGKLSEDTYNSFLAISTEMDILAAKENAHFAGQVRDTIMGDVVKNAQVGTAGAVSAQFKGAESNTFANNRMAALHLQPTGEEVNANAAKVREAITQALQSDSSVFGEDLLQTAQDISAGKISIKDVAGHNKYMILDKAMLALEGDDSLKGSEVFGQMQAAMIERARISQVLEEGMSKSTKSVIGSVNKSLNSTKVISNEVFAKEILNGKQNKYYNPDLASTVHDASYWIEQKVVISGKKEAFEVGDMRVLQLEDMLNRAESGNNSQELRNELTGWLNKYMLTESSEETWANLSPTTRKTLEKKFEKLTGTAEEIAKEKVHIMNEYFSDQIITGYSIISGSDSLRASLGNLKGLGGNSSVLSSPSNSKTAGLEFLGVTEAMNIIRQIDPSEGEKVFEASSKNFVPPKSSQRPPDVINELSNTFTEVGEKVKTDASETLSKLNGQMSVGAGLGMAALGVAAGLMVAGYAGGGHQRPTRPKDDSQPVEVAPMLDDEGQGDTGMRQQGYIININADTRKGARHLKSTMKDIAKASKSNGGVSINMNYRTTSGGGYSNKDIENIINNFI